LIQVAPYIGLLLAGLVCFVLHWFAPFRIARRLRDQYPQHWNVVIETKDGRSVRGMRLWLRMQHVLRSPAIAAIDDAQLNRWWRIWRYSQWTAWACWIAALSLQWFTRR
jgi:hypothetical protein